MSENMPEDRMLALEKKIDAIYATTEKTRKYFMWMLWITVAFVVVPTIVLLFAAPTFLTTYTDTLNSLDLEGL